MFWSNQKLKVNEKQLDWGTLRTVMIGQWGRGRKPVNITLPSDIGEIPAKEMLPYSIGLSKTYRPKLINSNGMSTWLAIDTLGAYGRGVTGHIQYLKSQANQIKLVAFGWGAFGDAGRLGYAPAALLEVKPNTIIRFKPTRCEWEVVQVDASGAVMYFNSNEIEAAIDVEVLKLDGDWTHMDWVEIDDLGKKENA